MFTMSSIGAAIAACGCSVVFGTVDWSKGYSAESFPLATLTIVLRDWPERAAHAGLKKLVGKKAVLCFGQPAMRGKFFADCFVPTGNINEFAKL